MPGPAKWRIVGAAAMLLASLSSAPAWAADSVKQTTFSSPEEGFNALVAAVRKDDMTALSAMLGAEGDIILDSGDPAADKMVKRVFLAAYDRASNIVRRDKTHAELDIGVDKWPFPIPVIKSSDRWIFDTEAGRKEVIARRIGRNELFTIQSALAYVDAQMEYASVDRGNGVLAYAQKFVSSNGKRDGLYWPATNGAPESPLGPMFAIARLEGYGFAQNESKPDKPTPYHGYYYKILTAQTAAATGGAYDYIVNGRMIGGFALVAFPAQYGLSGIMTFTVNQDGVVYQKDLGDKTDEIASKITRFDPGSGWEKAKAEMPAD